MTGLLTPYEWTPASAAIPGEQVLRQFMTALMTIVVIGTAAMLLHGEVKSSFNLNASAQEITALEDWGKMASKTHLQVHALCEAESAGGEAENEALARYQLCVAKARLAGAKGKRGERRNGSSAGSGRC